MSAKPDVEYMLIEDMASFYDDPLGYALYAFPREDGQGPDVWQAQQLQEIGREARTADAAIQFADATGHGVGKTTFASWVVLWAMSTRPHLAGVVSSYFLETVAFVEAADYHDAGYSGGGHARPAPFQLCIGAENAQGCRRRR